MVACCRGGGGTGEVRWGITLFRRRRRVLGRKANEDEGVHSAR